MSGMTSTGRRTVGLTSENGSPVAISGARAPRTGALRALPVAVGLALALLTAGCAGTDDSQAVDVGLDAASGTWTSQQWGTISIAADHSVDATGLRLNSGFPVSSCQESTGHGDWSFFRPAGGSSSTGDPKAIHGKSSGITLNRSDGTGVCDIYGFYVKKSSGISMCLVGDPDSDCADNELFVKKA
jgi:hypothetical protein